MSNNFSEGTWVVEYSKQQNAYHIQPLAVRYTTESIYKSDYKVIYKGSEDLCYTFLEEIRQRDNRIGQ